MFQIPENILDRLKCNLCDGYLNAKPVVVKDSKQICAKCYRILPLGEKEQCVREISFEAIGSCLVFPCRYHKMGCDYTFSWDNENGHESECTKRYLSIPDVVSTTKESPSLTDVLENSYESYSAKYGKIATTSLLNAEIRTGTTNLGFKNDLFEEHKSPAILLSYQRRDQFQKLPEILPYQELNNNSITSSNLYENIYSTISNSPGVFCNSCNTQVEKHNKHVCLFGHVSCSSCKDDMCIVCVKNLDGSSRIACKNASKGCKKILMQGDAAFHRDNCRYNDIACPIDKCQSKKLLEELKIHLKQDHSDNIITTNEISKKMGSRDQTLVFLCYDEIFKLSYFNYGSSIEIIVVYLGPCARASKYSLEVFLEVNKKIIKKSLECANWNNFSLVSGLSFDTKELLNSGDKKLNCVFNFKIVLASKQSSKTDLIQ